MLMTPGVGLFYGGLVRRKNIVSMIALSFVAFALISLMWVLFGYSLAFGSDIGGVIGGLDFLGLNGVGLEPYGPTTVPALTFALFQMMFATVTLAILTSVFAERAKLSAFIVFGLLWVTLVYVPVAHWIWGGGWLASLGAVDFAGGAVVHITAGFSALAVALVIGKRVGFGKEVMEPSNIPITMIGVALLWFGWFGFNGGSALAAGGLLATNAILVTNTSAAAGALTWMLLKLERWQACVPRHRERRIRRPGCNHPGGRIRGAIRCHRHRSHSRTAVLLVPGLPHQERPGRKP